MLGLLGEKLGMTQVYDADGNVHPVTVVKAGPCVVVQVKTKDADGYDAIQVGFGTPKSKRVNKAMRGHFEKKGVALFTYLREFRTEKAGEFKVGQELTVQDFQEGDKIDVQGITKGRGFQGVMKRHGKHGGPASHGSKVHRRPGSIGMCAWPGRVFKNMKLPGHFGVEKVTTKNLKVIEVRQDDGLLLISGSVPGCTGGLVTVLNRATDYESRIKFTAEEPAEVEKEAEQKVETEEQVHAEVEKSEEGSAAKEN